jgi:tetratricopeptide (TPR) repeat protein
LAICEDLGPEHPHTAPSLHNFALLLRAQGDFTEARPLFERALAICERTRGAEHPETNIVRCNLSRLLLRIGRPTEALSLGETALTAFDKVLGRNHPSTKGEGARVTADALDALGRAEEAKALRERYGIRGSDDPKPS